MRGNLSDLPKQATCGVINLDDVDEAGSAVRGGTHWCAFYSNSYFDSFGSPPPDELTNIRKIKQYSSTVNQDPSDVSCGYWCLMFLKLMKANKGNFQKTMAEIENVQKNELSQLA